MTKIRQLSDQSLKDIAAIKRQVQGVSLPAGNQTGSAAPKPGESVWYWGELMADLEAPIDGWTDATIGYAKLMGPDPENADDPREFTELAKGEITDATNASPIVITSAGHGRRAGDLVYITGVVGNDASNGPWRVINTTLDTFELAGSAGDGAYSSGGNWYWAVKFVNRAGFAASATVKCKLEHGWGEWSLKSIDC